MEDRVPSKPNRVRIVPEDGSPAFYATMTRADEPTQPGDPLNKSTFLKDETAALFGLDETAVPDDVFVKQAAQNDFFGNTLAQVSSFEELEFELITSTKTWTVPEVRDQRFIVFAVGGGGGGAFASINAKQCAGGGGSGHVQWKELTLTKGEKISVTCGTGGSGGKHSASGSSVYNGSDGGATKFGSYLTANGGGGGTTSAGGAGCAGGGCGGKGTLGGGGGGARNNNAGVTFPAGAGGTYGGGGGAGPGGTPGAKGANGGVGGEPGAVGAAGIKPNLIRALLFLLSTATNRTVVSSATGGATWGSLGTGAGGGGGGYGGNGGSAGAGGGGGGGGGFFASGGNECGGGGGIFGKGGNGGEISGDGTPDAPSGGGGGGFFADGGNATTRPVSGMAYTFAGGGGGFFDDGKDGGNNSGGAGGNGGVLVVYFKDMIGLI